MTKESMQHKNDYALEPVPDSEQTHGWAVGMVNGSLAFAVPGLITGIEIGQALGFYKSVAAFLVGGLILALLGSCTAIVGRSNRFTSYLTLKFVFGIWGAKIVSFCFVLSLLGWYGVNLDLFAYATNALLTDYMNITLNNTAIEWGGSVVIVMTTLYGFHRIERLAAYLVPVMAIVTALLLAKSVIAMEHLTAPVPSMSFGTAVSAVVGSFIVSIVLMPDLTRFCRKKHDAVIASFLPFFVLSSFVYIAASLAANVFLTADILTLMVKVGLGLAALLLLLCSSWLTNVLNLYSAALGTAAVGNSTKQHVLIIGLGILGVVASSLNLLDNFSDFLFSLSILFTPVAAIYCADFFILRRSALYSQEERIPSFNVVALLAWGLGVAFSIYSGYITFTITPIHAIDALVVSFLSYLVLAKVHARLFVPKESI